MEAHYITDSPDSTVFMDESVVPNLPCPDYETDYNAYDGPPHPDFLWENVETWKECGKSTMSNHFKHTLNFYYFYKIGKMCNSNVSCHFWTYVSDGRCIPKASAKGRTKTGPGYVSGSKECPGEW